MVAATIAATVAGFSPAAWAAEDVIKIGDINSYKRLPAHTIPYKNGVELALSQINAAGGVLGKKLVLVSRDDGGKLGETVKIAEGSPREVRDNPRVQEIYLGAGTTYKPVEEGEHG